MRDASSKRRDFGNHYAVFISLQNHPELHRLRPWLLTI
jgi:hypothetical protein